MDQEPPAHVPMNGFEAWVVIDLERLTVVRSNDRAGELLGISSARFPAELSDLVTAADYAVVSNLVVPLAKTGTPWQGDLRLGPQNGVTHPFEIGLSPCLVVPHISADPDVRATFATVVFSSPTAIDASLAVPDQLTGLPTRSALLHRLERAVWRNRETEQLLTIMFVDLDGLKQTNDRYGHEVGDMALIETSHRLVSCLPAGALAVRFGGDEFIVVHEAFSEIDEAVAFAERVLERLREPTGYQSISASIGLAFSRQGELDSNELLRRSDAAMYRAKANGGAQYAIFDAEMHAAERDTAQLRTSVIDAIYNDGFGIAAQPIFELSTGKVLGVELFIRVREGTPYVANASELFRLAYEYGEAFDAAVLGRALALSVTWRRAFGVEAPRLHINVSGQTLASPDFAERVKTTLDRHRVRPSAIALEIKCAGIDTSDRASRTAARDLQNLGVRLVIDDFGTHGLTLGEIADWRPAQVKISSRDHAPTVLAALVRAASSLQIETCIKGIENPAALAIASAVGSYAGQGNALSPVAQIRDVNDLLHRPSRIGF